MGSRDRAAFAANAAATLDRLYRETESRFGAVPYLSGHSGSSGINRQVDAITAYLPHVQAPAKVLDWGCHHAPDSCLLRLALGENVELFGCDILDPSRFAVFHDFARLNYVRLSDQFRLPYANEQFDLVIAAGVLEHCPIVGESLKELHRITRDGGQLVVTFMPNSTSVVEWIGRRTEWPHHRRLYSRRRLRHQLLDYGFEPTSIRFHQFIPAHRAQWLFEKLWWTNRVLERTWPLNTLSTNIMAIATRHSVI
jgi:SAM-dependent methyltransferase